MFHRSWKFAGCAWIEILGNMAAVDCGCGGEPARLDNQIYNRMVCVQKQGEKPIFIEMPKHWDLGSPSISPDGKSIAFDALTIGTAPAREAWLVGADGKGVRKLCDGGTPRWSPDGKRIIISRDFWVGALTGQRHHLFEIDVATGNEKNVGDGRFPDYSPDGKKIAYSRDGERTDNAGVHPGAILMIADADGSGAKKLCDGNWPSWSPDGKSIAYCDQEAMPNEMWVIEVATGTKTKIGDGFYRAQWAGDGKSFVCNAAKLSADQEFVYRKPGRFFLDKPGRPAIFDASMDNPFSPCLSADGKITALIVDSERIRKVESKPGKKAATDYAGGGAK